MPQRLALAVVLPAAEGGVLILLGEPAYVFWGLLTDLSVGYVLEGEWVGLQRVRGAAPVVIRILLGFPVVGALFALGMGLTDPMLVLPFFAGLGLVVTLLLPWAFVRLEGFLPR